MDVYKLVLEIQMIRIANAAAKYIGLQMGVLLELSRVIVLWGAIYQQLQSRMSA